MRISDRSSDVCSSDLRALLAEERGQMPNAWTRPEALAAIFRCVGRRSGTLNLFWRTRHMDMKRRELLRGATLEAAWAAVGVDIANDAFASSVPAGKIPGGDPEWNTRFLIERRADAQRHRHPR